MFKKLLCKIFGHTVNEYLYGKFTGSTIDGIGGQHGFYKWECSRCGKDVHYYVHIPEYFKFDRKLLEEKIRRDQ